MVYTKYVTATDTWRAVTVVFNDGNPVQLIFIIEDYESFFTDPLNNGVFKYVENDTLTRAWIDCEDLIFTWQMQTYNDGTINEGPVIGSHKESFGSLTDVIQTLRDSL